MEMSNCSCGCKLEYNLVFACSGAADVGSIADQAARSIVADRVAKMSCIAGVGAKDSEIMEWATNATNILTIDGCDKDCAAKTLESAGIHHTVRVRVTDLGMEKGKTPPTAERVGVVADKGKQLLV
jgi:uncharacterized metal-binding protein